MSKYVFSILLIIITHFFSGCYPQQFHGGGKIAPIYLKKVIYLGKGYSGSSINVSTFRQQAIIDFSNGIIVSFYNEDGDVVLIILDKSGQLTRKFIIRPRLNNLLLGDGHASINLGLSQDGIVHVMYGAHATKPYYAAIDLTQVTNQYNNAVLMARTWPDILSYPQFYNLGSELYLFYRNDHDSSLWVRHYNHTNRKWESGMMLVGAGNYSSVYWDHLAVKSNQVALSWVYRLPFDKDEKVKNKGIYLIKSPDNGRHWYDINGIEVRLPVLPDQIKPIIDLDGEKGLLNQGSSAWGNNGYLYMVHQHEDYHGIPQIYLSVIGNEQVYHQKVSDNKVDFELIGKGTLVLPLSRPKVLVSNRYIYVIYRQQNSLVIAAKEISKLRNNTRWDYIMPSVPKLRCWEPNYSLEAWLQKRKLILYVQSTEQGEEDRAKEAAPTSSYLYIFEEE